MSPECQGGAFAIDGSYSPRSNDVWSLGIILLNLATGRNPWRTATTDDLTFQAYLRDPLNFFPSVLPVSLEINDILVQLLHVDWRQRMTMRELRQQMEDVSVFYAADVVFEGSQARCAWEARMDAERDSSVPIQDQPKAIAAKELKSPWSEDSPEIDLGGQPYIRGSTSSGVDSSPFLFQREESGAPDRGDNGLRLDRRDSWDSSNSSSYSYATTPSTPADGVLENGTGRKVEELTMEDIYDEQIRRAQVRADSGGLSAMEAGESFNRPAAHWLVFHDARKQRDIVLDVARDAHFILLYGLGLQLRNHLCKVDHAFPRHICGTVYASSSRATILVWESRQQVQL
ncbi:putative protein tyrosine kinase [Lyophyllum shimeji]|uniref:Protein kinase domain-containing protein n=1 Tax=Lyophyllum shimeji TaxID=47721 RepID=A0A9P3PU53_LYOSH|nr:putative protein tyrosine kinase [Lyophyllum shimeji]